MVKFIHLQPHTVCIHAKTCNVYIYETITNLLKLAKFHIRTKELTGINKCFTH